MGGINQSLLRTHMLPQKLFVLTSICLFLHLYICLFLLPTYSHLNNLTGQDKMHQYNSYDIPKSVVQCTGGDLLKNEKPPFKYSLSPSLHQLSIPTRLTTLDHLSYLRRLGQGAQGAVYLVHDHRTNERLALKVIDIPCDESEVYMVKHERNATVFAQKKAIQGVVKIKEIFQDSGHCFILMHQGRVTLQDECRAYDYQLPFARICFIILDLVCSLIDMHSMGMIHRDIKPENILISPEGRAWLADFGMSHFGSKYTTGSYGTYEYMAPEVKRGSYDGRADVWSLGVLLYCLLLNCLPFDHEDRTRIPDIAASTPLSFKRGNISPDAEDLLSRMLTIDPKHRITMEEVSEHPFFENFFKDCSQVELESAKALPKSLRQPPKETYAGLKPMRDIIKPSECPQRFLSGYDWAADAWEISPESVVLLPMTEGWDSGSVATEMNYLSPSIGGIQVNLPYSALNPEFNGNIYSEFSSVNLLMSSKGTRKEINASLGELAYPTGEYGSISSTLPPLSYPAQFIQSDEDPLKSRRLLYPGDLDSLRLPPIHIPDSSESPAVVDYSSLEQTISQEAGSREGFVNYLRYPGGNTNSNLTLPPLKFILNPPNVSGLKRKRSDSSIFGDAGELLESPRKRFIPYLHFDYLSPTISGRSNLGYCLSGDCMMEEPRDLGFFSGQTPLITE